MSNLSENVQILSLNFISHRIEDENLVKHSHWKKEAKKNFSQTWLGRLHISEEVRKAISARLHTRNLGLSLLPGNCRKSSSEHKVWERMSFVQNVSAFTDAKSSSNKCRTKMLQRDSMKLGNSLKRKRHQPRDIEEFKKKCCLQKPNTNRPEDPKIEGVP